MDENGEILQPIREIGVKNAKPILLDFNVPKSSEVWEREPSDSLSVDKMLKCLIIYDAPI